jgi:alanine dehydrogenase
LTEVRFLSGSDIKNLLSMRDIIDSVENSFRAYGTGSTKLAPVTLTLVDKCDGEHEIKSGYVEGYSIGTKVLTYFPHNPALGLPTIFGLIVLNDLKDGRPLAVLDGRYITASRTGAAGAVAAKYLARNNSSIVSVIGTGTQARSQVAALNEIIKISSVKVYGRNHKNRSRYVEEMSKRFSFQFQAFDTVKEAVEDTDIIVTATPSTSALVQDEWVQGGVHINAIGADTPGKQELDPKTVARAKVVVDSLSQCVENGEIQTAIKMNLLKKENICELSEIVLGKKKGRLDEKEITLFDATGMAIEDITTAFAAYRLAVDRGVGVKVQLD